MNARSRRRILLYVAAVAVLAGLCWAGFVYKAEPDVPTLVNSAEILAQAGVFDRAIEDAERALRQDPDHAYAHVILGYACGQVGRHTESVDHYRRAVELTPIDQPTRATLRLHHAESLLSAGRAEEAVAGAKAVLADDPQAFQAYYVIGRAEKARGNPAEARAAFEAARRAMPTDPTPVMLLAGLVEEDGDPEGAEKLLGEALALSSGAAEVLLRRASLREVRGDHEGAVVDAVAAALKSRALTARTIASNASLASLRTEPRVVDALAVPAAKKNSGNS